MDCADLVSAARDLAWGSVTVSALALLAVIVASAFALRESSARRRESELRARSEARLQAAHCAEMERLAEAYSRDLRTAFRVAEAAVRMSGTLGGWAIRDEPTPEPIRSAEVQRMLAQARKGGSDERG